jgi:hypothetical protein
MQENTSMRLRRMLNEARQQQMGVKNPSVKTGLNTMGVLSAGKNKTTASRFGLKKAGI